MTRGSHDAPVAPAWVRGPVWDGFWILNGLWLVPLLWLLASSHDDPFESSADDIYFVLTLCFWIGHRLGSSYLAYCTTAYRPVVRAQPLRFIVAPCVVAALVFAIVLLPESVLPVPVVERIFWLALVDYLFVTYHFAAQHYGVLSLYRLRGGEPRTPAARRVDRLFALGVGGVMVIAAEVIAGRVARQDEWLDPILSGWWDPSPDMPWWEAYESALAWSGSSLVALLALGIAVAALRRGNLPRALYALSIGALVWMAFRVSALVFIMAWTAQHWITATGLAARVAAGDPDPGPSRWYRFWHHLNRRPAAVIAFLAFASALLLPVMEVEAAAADEPSYGARLVPGVMDWLTQDAVVPWLVALGFTTGFVHYLLDRAVYRFSDPAAREAARGLLRAKEKARK